MIKKMMIIEMTQRSSSTFCPLPNPGLPAFSFLPSLSPQGPLFLLVLMLFIQGSAELPPYFFQVSVYTACFGKDFTHRTPPQYSCLENPMDREVWQAAVHGVTKSRTQLSNFTSLFTSLNISHNLISPVCLLSPSSWLLTVLCPTHTVCKCVYRTYRHTYVHTHTCKSDKCVFVYASM